MEKFFIYLKLNEIFKRNGFKLYIVGGAVRDFLLGKDIEDVDLTTDAKPDDIKKFLIDTNIDYTFSKFGFLKIYFNDVKFDLTTLRKEKGYGDFRHPKKIIFISSLKRDSLRRDFTINAMYLDEHLTLIDFHNGAKDLKNNVLKMVGKANKRIKEDPLRIIRAIRFIADYDLTPDSDLIAAVIKNKHLLNELNPSKIKSEFKKIKCKNNETIRTILEKFSILYLIDMIE